MPACLLRGSVATGHPFAFANWHRRIEKRLARKFLASLFYWCSFAARKQVICGYAVERAWLLSSPCRDTGRRRCTERGGHRESGGVTVSVASCGPSRTSAPTKTSACAMPISIKVFEGAGNFFQKVSCIPLRFFKSSRIVSFALFQPRIADHHVYRQRHGKVCCQLHLLAQDRRCLLGHGALGL